MRAGGGKPPCFQTCSFCFQMAMLTDEAEQIHPVFWVERSSQSSRPVCYCGFVTGFVTTRLNPNQMIQLYLYLPPCMKGRFQVAFLAPQQSLPWQPESLGLSCPLHVAVDWTATMAS